MRYVAAYLLLQLGGNASPTAEDIKRVLGSVGIEADNDRLDKLVAALKDKDTNELIAQGTAKLASIPSDGVGSGAAAPAATAAVDTAVKVEETPSKDADGAGEESDEDFGISLFD